MNSQKNFHNTMDDNLINNYLKIVQTVVPKNDVTGNQKKKTKKKKKKTKVRDNDLDSSEESVESNASSAEELSQDDLEHMREKARVEKWMRDDEDDPEPNWWDILPPNRPYHPIDEIPPNHYSDSGSWSSFSPFRVSKGLTSFFGSILPSISWGLGNKPDVFSDDPFFQEFRGFKGRSIGDDDKRSFSWLFGKSGAVGQTGGDIPTSGGGGALDTIHHRRGPDKISKRRNYKGKSSKNKNNRARKGHSNEEADNPAEKFQLAIEIGKQMEDPNECNFVFTGCPFSYLEIIEIIESSKKSAAQEIGQDDKQLNYLEIFGLGNNSDLSNTHYFPTTSDRLEINLKIADKNVATLIPHSSNLRNPDDDFTLEISTAPSNTNNLQVESQPPTDAINHHHAPLPTMFRTDVLQGESVNSNVGGGGSEDDSVEHNLIRPQTTINPKITKRRKSKGPARINTRQQWGSKHGLKLAPLVKHSSSPTILRQSQQLHTHTKYKHIPLPTTINKPSHVINYHFHNTNTHPQVSHNPQQLSVHSYPPPATPLNIQQPHYYTQQPVHQSTLSSTTVAAQTTPSTSSSGFRNDLKSKRHKKRRRNKPKRKRKNPVSEERIIIRLPEPTQQPNNNYYNLYPLLNNPTYNSPPPQQQSQADQQYHHHHQNQHYSHHIPHRHSSPQPTYFAPQHPGYQSHQSSYPFYPHSPLMPPGIFSYVLGKK
ncbi:LIM domain-containing protein A-like [Folsomia candida]|nr:LIM domain-containing protein A-like [Folsomia candida]